MAPMNRDGAKMPPEPPDPMVREVAAILAKTRAKRRNQDSFPKRARVMDS